MALSQHVDTIEGLICKGRYDQAREGVLLTLKSHRISFFILYS